MSACALLLLGLLTGPVNPALSSVGSSDCGCGGPSQLSASCFPTANFPFSSVNINQPFFIHFSTVVITINSAGSCPGQFGTLTSAFASPPQANGFAFTLPPFFIFTGPNPTATATTIVVLFGNTPNGTYRMETTAAVGVNRSTATCLFVINR